MHGGDKDDICMSMFVLITHLTTGITCAVAEIARTYDTPAIVGESYQSNMWDAL